MAEQSKPPVSTVVRIPDVTIGSRSGVTVPAPLLCFPSKSAVLTAVGAFRTRPFRRPGVSTRNGLQKLTRRPQADVLERAHLHSVACLGKSEADLG